MKGLVDIMFLQKVIQYLKQILKRTEMEAYRNLFRKPGML